MRMAFLFLLFLGWGSFLNMLGYRLIHGGFEHLRSFCPKCKATIAGYDNIPLLSWILLRGKCRSCKKTISIIYPFIELFTALSITALWLAVPFQYFPAYFIFFSALIVTIRTDFESMLISRFVTLFLVPVGLLLSYMGYLPITLEDSFLGSIIGYLFLWITAQLFYRLTGKHGLGQGDVELLCFIGSFSGILGCWMSLVLGSILGSVIGIYAMLTDRNWRTKKIPFGPFLAFGAMIFILYQDQIIRLMMHGYY